MTPEERSLLEKTHELAKANNVMLHKLNRHARLGTWGKVFYWVVIIGLFFGAFYFIQPYIDFIKSMAGVGSAKSSNSSPSYVEQLQDLLK